MSYTSELKAVVKENVDKIKGKTPQQAVKMIDNIIEKERSLLKFEAAYELYDQYLMRAVTKELTKKRRDPIAPQGALDVPYYIADRTAKPIGKMNKEDLVVASIQYRAKANDNAVKAVLLDALAGKVQDKTVEETVSPSEFGALVDEIVRRGDARHVLGESGSTS